MMLYARKLRRELWRQRGPTIAVLTVTALGVMLFVASAGAYRDLRDSYAATCLRLALAGLHVEVAGLTEDDIHQAAALRGVAEVEARIVTEVPASPSDADGGRAALRLISLPDEGEPSLDRVLLLEGRMPGQDEILLEKHFARYHGLAPGTMLPLGAGAAPLRVSGVAVSAEYLWVSRNENDIMPSPADFGVGWMRRAALRSLARRIIDAAGQAMQSSSLLAAAEESPGTELLVQPDRGADPAGVAASLRATLGGVRVIKLTRGEDLVGVRLLQMDVDGYRGMAAFFPVLFLGVAAFVIASLLARIVDAQRSVIGTFLALGVGRAKLLGHYLSHALALGGAGAVLGAALGLVLAPLMTREYATELNIPFVEAHAHFDLVAWGVLMGVAVSTLAGLVPAVRAMRLMPAEAMRPSRPSIGSLARLARRLAAPLPVRLSVRDLLGRPLRSLATALGVSAAVVLVLSTGSMLDSMKTTFGAIFDDARAYDIRVDFASPVPTDTVSEPIRAEPGVLEVEAFLALPVRLEARGRTTDVLLEALPDRGDLVRVIDIDGRRVPLGDGGVAVTRVAARKLNVAPGDEIVLRPLPQGDPVTLRVAGFADAAMGSTASVRRGAVERPWHLWGLATTLVARTAAGKSSAVRAALTTALPGATRIEDAAGTRAEFQSLMGLGWVMLGAMLFFGGVLAAAILFNTATLNVLERRRELATLRTLGVTMREIATMVTVEHALLALLGLALGVPLAVVVSRAMLRAFSSDLFALPFVLSARTVAITLSSIFVLTLLAQWPALRRVARSNLADEVRVQEG
jgi:putative ABC transport system permease protein